MGSLEQQIVDTTEVRRHNGQCEYGEWVDLTSEDVPQVVRQAVAEEIAEAMCRDIRHQPSGGNPDEEGMVLVGSETWVYRR